MQDIKKLKEAFKKYRKEHLIDSEPEDYIHVGLDSSFQFSDFIKDIEKNLKKAYQRGVDDTIKRNNQNAPIGSTCDDTPIMKTYN